MQDRPEAAELLEAVAGFLYEEVRDRVADDQRFQVLVAANSCAIVARELRAGEDPAGADLALFRELLGDRAVGAIADVAAASREAAQALAERIRSGAADDELERVLERLREHTRRKLDITRPGYASQ